jgi:hypothetical protein
MADPVQRENAVIATSITNFRDQIRELARPNLFQVEIIPPPILGNSSSIATGNDSSGLNTSANGGATTSNASALALSTVLVKAANIPASTVGVIEVPFRGRMLKIAGDRSYEPWTVTVLNDQAFAIRKYFEIWSSYIQRLDVNLQTAATIADYQSNAIVRQLTRQGTVVRSYKFEGIWPSAISAIDLAWETNDTVEEYTVEFQVQHIDFVDDTNTANGQTDGRGNGSGATAG